jgi:type IV secretory pathway VirB10-like protein
LQKAGGLIKEMERKTKIVIPVGGASKDAVPASNFDGGATVPAPLFDEEATISARPVVPLTEASKGLSSRFPLLALVVVLAISAGVAGGFAIGVYRSRQNRATAATKTTTAATTLSTDATAQTPAGEQLPVIASEKSPEPRPRATEAENAPTERIVRDSKPSKDDDEQIIPPVEVRERAREKREQKREERREAAIKIKDDDERESKRQRKEQRRRARANDERDVDFNRQIERAGQEVNRIREIFEGQRP